MTNSPTSAHRQRIEMAAAMARHAAWMWFVFAVCLAVGSVAIVTIILTHA